jgi:Rrf2 family transcriptional regulator, iron-sulfur cluster assembly transcription factor
MIRGRAQVHPLELLQSPLYSPSCQDALKIIERIAALSREGRPAADFSTLGAETGMSVPTLKQVVFFLQRAGLLKPQTAEGSVSLARAPEKISMRDVVAAVDGSGLWTRCLLGLASCSDATPCPVHSVWKKARTLLERQLESQSIADLSRAMNEKRRRPAAPSPSKPSRRHRARPRRRPKD